MRPKRPAAEDRQDDLFRLRLEAIIDPRHPLVRLAAAIDWPVFDAARRMAGARSDPRPR